MRAELQYSGQGLHLVGQARSGHSLSFDASTEVGGTDLAIRPMEALLLSMMACFSADVVSILQKKRKHLTGYSLFAEADRAATFPQVFTAVRLHMRVQSADADPADIERAITLSRTKYCSAMAMFERAGCQVQIRYELVR